jgi:hypothetical protein
MEDKQSNSLDVVYGVVDKIFKNSFSIAEIMQWNVADIRNLCEILGLQKDGSKRQLIDEVAKAVFARSAALDVNVKVRELLQKTALIGTTPASIRTHGESSTNNLIPEVNDSTGIQ